MISKGEINNGIFISERCLIDSKATSDSVLILAKKDWEYSLLFKDFNIEQKEYILKQLCILLDHFNNNDANHWQESLLKGIYKDKNNVITYNKTNELIGLVMSERLMERLISSSVKFSHGHLNRIVIDLDDFTNAVNHLSRVMRKNVNVLRKNKVEGR